MGKSITFATLIMLLSVPAWAITSNSADPAALSYRNAEGSVTAQWLKINPVNGLILARGGPGAGGAGAGPGAGAGAGGDAGIGPGAGPGPGAGAGGDDGIGSGAQAGPHGAGPQSGLQTGPQDGTGLQNGPGPQAGPGPSAGAGSQAGPGLGRN